MSKVLEEYIGTVVKNTASILNIKGFEYSSRHFADIGQNYFGILIPIVLHDNKNEVNVSLILKLAPTEDNRRLSGAVSVMFTREIFIYSILFRKYKELQQNVSSSHHFLAPHCYYVCKDHGKEVIVMQDMCEKGYKPYVHNKFLDLDHVVVSLRSLAKFHALSFILKKVDKRVYDEVAEMCVPLSEKNNERFMIILLDRLKKAIDKFKNTSYVTMLERLKENCINIIESATYSAVETCICHGDMWKENILFKYENEKPISACIIDYQTTRICSPAFDVLYFIASSTNSDFRRNNFSQLLNIYHGTFVEFIQEAGMDSVVYPRETLDKDLMVVAPACLIIANTALWLSHGLQEDGVVRSKIIWTTDEEKALAVDQYKSIIKDIIDDFSSYGYLSMYL